MAKYTCPYCLTEHSFSEVEFRCINTFCTVKEPDVQYANYLGLKAESAVQANATFPSKAKIPFLLRNSFMPVWENCPHCKTKSSMRVCPSCHNELPEGIQDNEDMIIAVVGSRDTGKTHFITVLINELRTRICPDIFRGTFEPINDDAFRHYQEHFYNKVFLDKTLQDLTTSGAAKGENIVRKPLIFEMMVPLDEQGKKRRKYTFVFYDTAGEDLKNEMLMKTVNRYICKASGIIFLLDPMQIMELRLNMSDEEINSSSSIKVEEIEPQQMVLKRIAKQIREDRGGEKVNIPVAIAFSKFDVLKRFFPKGSIVLEPSSYLREGHLDKNEWFTVSSEIEAMLQEWGAKGFTANVKMLFSNYTYCTLSALGQQPTVASNGVKKLVSMPMPHRVEDPFLWMLKENGVIRQK